MNDYEDIHLGDYMEDDLKKIALAQHLGYEPEDLHLINLQGEYYHCLGATYRVLCRQDANNFINEPENEGVDFDFFDGYYIFEG